MDQRVKDLEEEFGEALRAARAERDQEEADRIHQELPEIPTEGSVAVIIPRRKKRGRPKRKR